MIVVTGGAGFIGSHLCRRLAALGAHVVSLDDYSLGSRSNHVAGVDYREGSTRYIAEHVPERPDLIYHLGEFSRVERSVTEAAHVHESNELGTGAVLTYWGDRGCKLVYAGSSTRFACDDSLSPYAATKRRNADLTLAVGAHHRLPHAVTYFYNVYGPGERAGWSGTVVETFRLHRRRGLPLPVVRPGTQRRNFTHVDDIVDGLLLVGEHGCGEYPIGAAESYSVLELAEMFGGELNMLPERQGNRFASSIDTSRIEALGWRQRHQLKDYVNGLLLERAA